MRCITCESYHAIIRIHVDIPALSQLVTMQGHLHLGRDIRVLDGSLGTVPRVTYAFSAEFPAFFIDWVALWAKAGPANAIPSNRPGSIFTLVLPFILPPHFSLSSLVSAEVWQREWSRD
jgi:hypothetical protein